MPDNEQNAEAMTPEKTRMEAGPELDALIERDVFGKIIRRDGRGFWYTMRGETDSIHKRVRPFSTDRAAAHEVLERLMLEPPCERTHVVIEGPSKAWPEWIVRWSDESDYVGSALTFPLAACRFALSYKAALAANAGKKR